ncbi:MAG TPA: metal-dependent hydrolase [Novosphingobium sp.]|nr:metal-dependent hydrolase [Novosphingobium sp.]
MNAFSPLERSLGPASGGGKLTGCNNSVITVRDRRFLRDGAQRRWWANGDPVATAWFTALSACFPRGEAFFIEAVKAHRDGVPDDLAEDIRGFIAQEINHSREHLALNRLAEAAGYDLAEVDQRLAAFLDMTRGRPAIVNLAATIALEHFTAMMAHELLSNPRHLAGCDPEFRALWEWHAAEEIEHKAVAFDTWRHATRNWSRWRRWKLKALMMAIVSANFIKHRWRDTLSLLAADGITGWRAKTRVVRFLLVRPGILRAIVPAWIAWFLPGFHPWQVDDRALITQAEARLSGD